MIHPQIMFYNVLTSFHRKVEQQSRYFYTFRDIVSTELTILKAADLMLVFLEHFELFLYYKKEEGKVFFQFPCSSSVNLLGN